MSFSPSILATRAAFPFQAVFRGLATVTTTGGGVSPALSAKGASLLELKTGETFKATSFGAPRSISGELVFTTSLVGYPESMTDPSYRGQIIVFTQPLIGNYGVPGLDRDEFGLLRYFESERIQVSGIVVSNYSAKYSHWTAVESLGQWCARSGVPAFSGVDTRALTKVLRENGSTLGKMLVPGHDGKVAFEDPNKNVCYLPFFFFLFFLAQGPRSSILCFFSC